MCDPFNDLFYRTHFVEFPYYQSLKQTLCAITSLTADPCRYLRVQAFAVSARDEKFGWMFDPNARVPDTAPANMLEIIPKHWYNFPPVNPLWHYMLGMIYIVLCECFFACDLTRDSV